MLKWSVAIRLQIGNERVVRRCRPMNQVNLEETRSPMQLLALRENHERFSIKRTTTLPTQQIRAWLHDQIYEEHLSDRAIGPTRLNR